MNRDYLDYVKPVRTAAIVLLVVGAVYLAAQSVSLVRAWSAPVGNETRAEIVVQGKGEIFAVPDIATFAFTVQEEGATVKDAQDKAARKNNAAIEYLKNAGIAEKDIKTVAYNANPKYEYQSVKCKDGGFCPPGKQVLVGYEVSQSVEVKVRDTNKAGTILSGIGGQNVQYVSGLQFTIDDAEKIMSQAREKAVADAKVKAEILAKDLGVKIVRIKAFSENQQGAYPMPFYDLKNAAGRSEAASIAPSMPTGENKYTSNVSIVYEVK